MQTLQSFLNYLEYEKRYSKHTLSSYQTDINQLLSFCKDQFEISEVKSIQALHVRSWMVHMISNGLKPKSVNRKLSACRNFFQFLKRRREIQHNPLSKIVPPKSGKRLPSYIQEKNMEKLEDGMVFASDFAGIRDRLIIELFYYTGIRRSELIGLKERDVDLSARQIKVLGKGNKERVLPLSPDIIETIEQYRQAKRDEGFEDQDILIVTDKGEKCYPKFVYNLVKKYLSLVTTSQKRSPHVLRHTFATHLVNNGAELNAVKSLLGHSSLAATQIYTHNSIEKLKEVYKNAFPKADSE